MALLKMKPHLQCDRRYLAAAKARWTNGTVCQIADINAEPDTRVKVDMTGLGEFVDIASKTSKGSASFCK